MNRKLLVVTMLAGSLSLAACSSNSAKNRSAAELPPQPSAGTTTTTPPPAGPSGPTAGSQADFVASVQSDTIHFDLDRYNVDAQSQAILQSQAQWLARYPGKLVTIEGHCDERGTRDYNIALGERRANAAKAYLVSLGIDASRITTVSYGKERPIALGSDEASYAQNRRAVTVTVQ
ncbi:MULTISPECIES: peptidoglycan-associated lipoprotein Pal [unclassified Novosphingobium]|uniref:peptidoglycan-associated lipoprotein Pal n=1 Tax=Novosphingobium TaxID=165696 RepID=UPI001448824E|nr:MULTISPECIES: peptidoglycan-associated lipoprotein Pal [unclassified Novosphingobium]NKJ41135.1 peptidoglycan-associated lipoprotein [Novosphingobium sp. SG720]NMN03384.1 peptidoglycan-associated lipoprotein [Novosphingobium sp. SG919]NMN86626.1 peptidoglycan-associated lipoprotein [Novosphingobium sp. SG916]